LTTTAPRRRTAACSRPIPGPPGDDGHTAVKRSHGRGEAKCPGPAPAGRRRASPTCSQPDRAAPVGCRSTTSWISCAAMMMTCRRGAAGCRAAGSVAIRACWRAVGADHRRPPRVRRVRGGPSATSGTGTGWRPARPHVDWRALQDLRRPGSVPSPGRGDRVSGSPGRCHGGAQRPAALARRASDTCGTVRGSGPRRRGSRGLWQPRPFSDVEDRARRGLAPQVAVRLGSTRPRPASCLAVLDRAAADVGHVRSSSPWGPSAGGPPSPSRPPAVGSGRDLPGSVSSRRASRRSIRQSAPAGKDAWAASSCWPR
jgi:hypothetical protein